MIRIPHRLWNQKVVGVLPDCIALPGMNCLIIVTPTGRIVTFTGGSGWQHPWYTQASWNGIEERFEATVKVGFENGIDPIVPGAGEAGADVDLVDNPRLPLHAFRSIDGTDEAVPAFFKALGVREVKDDFAIEGDTIVPVDNTDASNLPPRYLLACDFYLAKARATYQGRATEVDASGTSGVTVDYSVQYNTDNLDRVGARARLMQAAKYPAIKEPTLAERLLGTYTDEGEDRQLVSTIYFLSPPLVSAAVPDQQWTPIPAHTLFWSVDHAARNLPPAKPPQPIRLFTGLLGGLGDLIANQALSGINEYSARVLNAVNTTSNAGRFWTS